MMSYVEYSSNNSGGDWWLKDADWHALEAAGWIVCWAWQSPKYTKAGRYERDPKTGVPVLVLKKDNGSKFQFDNIEVGGRWLGALAKSAYRIGLSLRDAAAEWEKVTGACATDAGCPCCGQPHNFTEYTTDGEFVTSGPETSYSASW